MHLSRRQRGCLFALLAATLALRLAVALADHRSLIGLDIYQDDAFYYFKIAQNIVAGRGMTFDGLTATNAFQPLYLLLLLPVMAASGSDLIAPIHASAVLLALVALATGALVFRLTRRLASARTGLVALALWAGSPYFTLFGINGLETGLAMLLALCVITGYVEWVQLPARTGAAPHAARLGLVCGLAVLARFDLILLVAALALDWALAGVRRRRMRPVLVGLAQTGAIALAVWLPWGVISYRATGVWAPASGAATGQIALEYGWKNLQPIWAPSRLAAPGGGQWFDPDRVPPAYYADVATQQTLVFLFEHPLLVPLRVHLPFSVWPRLDRYPLYAAFQRAPLASLAVALLLAGGAVAALYRRSRIAVLPCAYLALTFLGYTFYCPAHWYYPRYLAPAVLITLVCGLAMLREQLRPAWRRGGLARGAVVAGLVLVLAGQLAIARNSTLSRISWRETAPGGFLRAWLLLEGRIDPSRRLGAFQAGNFSYFGRRDVINLDGKVNREAQQALADGDLAGYIARRKIDYVLDWPWVLESLCLRHMRPGELSFREIAREPDGYGFVLYAVER